MGDLGNKKPQEHQTPVGMKPLAFGILNASDATYALVSALNRETRSLTTPPLPDHPPAHENFNASHLGWMMKRGRDPDSFVRQVSIAARKASL